MMLRAVPILPNLRAKTIFAKGERMRPDRTVPTPALMTDGGLSCGSTACWPRSVSLRSGRRIHLLTQGGFALSADGSGVFFPAGSLLRNYASCRSSSVRFELLVCNDGAAFS